METRLGQGTDSLRHVLDCMPGGEMREELCNLHARADQSSRTMERDAKVSSKKLDEASLNLAEVLS